MTRGNSSVAVVIATKNGAPFIRETIEGVLAQTRLPDEIVVVDDGSTDDTVEIVRTYPEVHVMATAAPGANQARVTGERATTSDLIAFLDHDDVWYSHHLEVLVPVLEQCPGAAAAFGAAASFTTRLPRLVATPHETELVDPWATFPGGSSPGSPSAVLVRRSALEAIGGWPRWNRIHTDTYVWLRLADVGPLVRWRGNTIGYRVHDSMSRLARRHDLERAMASRHSLLTDALDEHAKCVPTPDLFRARLDLLARVDAVTAATWRGSTAALARSVTELVEATDKLELEPFTDMLHAYADDLRTSIRDLPSVRSNFVRAYAGWPRQHLAWRRRLADPLAVTALLWGVRRDPLHPSRWGIPIVPGVHKLLAPVARRALVVGRQRVGALATRVAPSKIES